jgi:hypothetical protein
MKVSVKDLSREHVWKVADVRNIPDGWKRQVWYDPDEEELYGVLLSGGEKYIPGRGHIYLDTFVSLSEFWTNCPLKEEDIGITEETPYWDREYAIYNAYMEIWWDEFEFPPELL